MTEYFCECRQTFGGSCSRTIARLLASVAHFSLEANGFEVRLVYAFDNDETARAMRDIGEHAYENTTVWRKTEWLQRSWLTEQMSLVMCTSLIKAALVCNNALALFSAREVSSFCAVHQFIQARVAVIISTFVRQLVHPC